MKSAADAVSAYETGVRLFGVENYSRCGDVGGGFMAVARCLHDAKKKALSLANMVEKYRQAAGG
jgi:hypothetical protein